MTAPIFEVVAVDAAVRAVLGAGPVRFYLFGMAPQNSPLPYAVWQVVGGSPENYLAGRPDADSFTLQVDAYGDDPLITRRIVEVLRDAIELHAHITLWLGESQDPATKRWRSSFRLDWITSR
ncbi:DUF3168 domain-containing protein [Pantoea sp. 18069]|uniref:tail completion protein gp17 n=1 Tax=Pantoea sp. 18069 TaxID=2681415 RepID=UPI0013572FB7|nr:DUF3168 domain-containing protein [Pantoea sp. 18069]